MDASIIFNSALRTQGHKITKNRTAILEFLSHQNIPISADEILKHINIEHQDFHARVLVSSDLDKPKLTNKHSFSPVLQKAKLTNKTTIYRELFFLLENNFIKEVEFGDGKKRYEITLNKPHHHHVVCLNCKEIVNIPLEKELDEEENKIEKITNFKLTSHMLEFFGLCPNCK